MADLPVAELHTLLNTICGDSMQETMSEYNSLMRTFIKHCFSDSSMDIVITGAGYDNMPPFYKMFDFGPGQLTARPRLGGQCVHAIYKKIVVLDSPTAEYSEGGKLFLYGTPANRYDHDCGTGKLILHVSSRTYSCFQRESLGTSFEPSVVVRLNDQQVPKFHLSSGIFSEVFQKDHSPLLLYQLPATMLDLRQLFKPKNITDSNRLTEEGTCKMDESSTWYESQKHSIGALRLLPALECHQWPKCASDWASRSRIWPKNSLVQKVLNSRVVLIPFLEDGASHKEMSEEENIKEEEGVTKRVDDLLWTFDFSDAELILLSHLTAETKRVFFLFQALVNDPVSAYAALKHVLLWCVEVHGPDLGGTGSSFNEKVELVVSKLEEFLVEGGIPNYFVPDSTILHSTDIGTLRHREGISAEKGALQYTLFSTTGLSSIANVNDLTYCSNTIFKNFVHQLRLTMEHNTRLLGIQMYRMLHNGDMPQKSIEIHHHVQRTLDAQIDIPYPKLHRVIEDFVQSSLGGMYLVQGVTSRNAEEKMKLFRKAEEHFSDLRSCDMLSNKLRLALLLLKQEKYQSVLDALEGVLDKLYAEILATELVCPEDREANYETNVPFLNCLENAAVYTMNNMEYLVMRMERTGLSAVISKNLSLAQYQLLGCTRQPVNLLDISILCGVLMSHAYSSLKRYKEANQALEKVESLSLKDEVDMNEKRGCFYLNIISDAYSKAQNPEQAKYLLQRSVTIMGNPRNPGRWALVSMNTKKMRDYVLGGMGVAMATTIAAVTINFILNRK